MTPPPPAEQLASRILLGPALRTQPDRRLVTLVREGYESAFEEIVRRYRRPLDRFAASFVGGRSEDVTQDAFSKALLALRGSKAEIELRPWLYRIVRNTALNDLRDRPPSTEELGEAIPGGRSAAAEAEGREEMTELMDRLRALPEPQRAAIVMRELEGLSHEEIAASLGLSGGAARQAIYRARQSLRGGFGMLVPLPLLRALFDHGNEAAGAGAGGAVAVAGAAGGGSAGAVLGGLGAGGALKVGLATALIAGSVGAGVALDHGRGDRGSHHASTSSALTLPVGDLGGQGSSGRQRALEGTERQGGGVHRDGDRGGGSDDGARGDNRNHPHSEDRGSDNRISVDSDGFDDSGPGGGNSGSGGHGGGGPDEDGGRGGSGSGEGSGQRSSGGDSSGGGQSSRHDSGGSGDDSRGGGGSGGHGGSGGSGGSGNPGGSNQSGGGSDTGGSGGDGNHGSGGGDGSPAAGEPAPVTAPAPIEEPPSTIGGDGSGGGDSGSHGGSGSGDSGGGGTDS